MKKILLVAVVGLLFASSCSGEKKPKTKNANAPKAVAAEGIKHITKAEYLTLVWNYEKNPSTFVFEGKLPVIVDFYATWCGPCQMLGPIVEQLGTELSGIKVMKCNVDEEGELAAKFGIESIPALLKFKNGQVAAKSIGFKPKEAIKAFMEG